MNNGMKICMLGISVLFAIGLFLIITAEPTPKLEKLSHCVNLADKAGLDPNVDKPAFIKYCME